MIKNEEIGGVKLELSIGFDPNDNREYLDKITEIQFKIADLIKELGNNYLIVGTSEPILKSELKEE